MQNQYINKEIFRRKLIYKHKNPMGKCWNKLRYIKFNKNKYFLWKC